MAYVQQVCEGYGKGSLMGNWNEERLYPPQPFRENLTKQPRPKEQAITTFDGTSFQRALPRLERRPKWDTNNRIILDEGIKNAPSVTRAEYPENELQSYNEEMRKPYDKNSGGVSGTSIYPHSQVKPKQTSYHIVDPKNSQQIKELRDVLMYGSDFKSTLLQHPPTEKFTNYTSEYKGRISGQNDPLRTRTVSQFMQTRQPAGNFRQVYPEQTVKPITTLFCENRKEEGDEKQRTGVQRSWVPQRDKALSYSMGQTGEKFKRAGELHNDLQTNLNINTGVHKLHPQQIPDNYFRHTRTITVNHNKNLTNRP